MLFLADLARSSCQNSVDLWVTNGWGMGVFRDTKSKNWFTFLLSYLRFDSPSTRNERIMRDQLTTIRYLSKNFLK